MFVMEKSKGLKLDTPNYNLEEKYKGMLMIDSQTDMSKTPVKKQPDYRKLEGKKRF